jgi:hypothetical protein
MKWVDVIWCKINFDILVSFDLNSIIIKGLSNMYNVAHIGQN